MSHNKGMSHRSKGIEWGIKGEAVCGDKLASCASEQGNNKMRLKQ
jgi:hypothetical protein